MTKWWTSLSPQEREAHVIKQQETRLATQKWSGTDIERMVATLLDALSVKYIAQLRIGRYTVDFCVSSKSLIVEADGSYWHSSPDAIARSQRRDMYLMSRGYRVLHLSDREIYAGQFEALTRSLA